MHSSHGPQWYGRGPGYRGPGKHMFRRFVGFIFFLLFASAVIGAVIATGFAAVSGTDRWIIVGVIAAGLIVFGLLARRVFRTSWLPVGELIEATSRLGEGDHQIRLTTRRPGPFTAVASSFNKMAERLEDEDERRRRLLADIGHELRTPMTVIRGEIEAVLDGLHSPGQLEDVIEEVELVERLLEDLRLLSMAEAGTLRLETESTDLVDLVRTVIKSFASTSSSKSVDVVVVTPNEMPEIELDPHRIQQVISNLVSNGLNHTQPGGRLEVTVSQLDELAILQVADTGPGIEEADLDRVFDRFVRASDSTGTGLGLSISRDLVNAHGGTISAANRETGGAVFTVSLPI